LRIIGNKGESGLYYVPVIIESKTFSKLTIQLRFYIDTDASFTAISDTDAIKNNIPYRNLQFNPRPIVGIGKGHIYSRVLQNCKIYFLNDENKLYNEICPNLNIIFRDDESYAIKYPAVSLLGLDILKKFNIYFTDSFAFLEK